MQVTTDQSLIEEIGAGNKLALRTLYVRHQVKVFRFLCGIVRDRSVAEDLVNDVFIDIWHQASRFEGRSTVSTWVLAIARYKALSTLRRPSTEEFDEERAAAIEDEADDPEVIAQKRTKGELLRDCLARLSAEHREIVDLVYYQEKSIEECSAIISIPENTVKTRLFHARKKLAELAKSIGLDRGWP